MTERECVLRIIEALGGLRVPWTDTRGEDAILSPAEAVLREYVAELAAKNAGQAEAIDMLKGQIAAPEGRLKELANRAREIAAAAENFRAKPIVVPIVQPTHVAAPLHIKKRPPDS